MAQTTTSTMLFHAPSTLRVMGCQACGLAFAVPAAWHLARADQRQPITCPACTHPNAINYPTESAERDAVIGTALLVEQLATAKLRLEGQEAELSALRAQLGTAGVGLPDNREVKRRCNLLAARAETSRVRSHAGEPICPHCGKPKDSVNDLATHLYRRYREQVRRMPAEQFE